MIDGPEECSIRLIYWEWNAHDDDKSLKAAPFNQIPLCAADPRDDIPCHCDDVDECAIKTGCDYLKEF